MSRLSCSASGRSRAPTHTCGQTPNRSRSETMAGWSKAVVVAYAVHESGVREVIGLDVGEVESGAFWVEFLRGLKRRGLSGVRLAGLRSARGAQGSDRARARMSVAALHGPLHQGYGHALPPRPA